MPGVRAATSSSSRHRLDTTGEGGQDMVSDSPLIPLRPDAALIDHLSSFGTGWSLEMPAAPSLAGYSLLEGRGERTLSVTRSGKAKNCCNTLLCSVIDTIRRLTHKQIVATAKIIAVVTIIYTSSESITVDVTVIEPAAEGGDEGIIIIYVLVVGDTTAIVSAFCSSRRMRRVLVLPRAGFPRTFPPARSGFQVFATHARKPARMRIRHIRVCAVANDVHKTCGCIIIRSLSKQL